MDDRDKSDLNDFSKGSDDSDTEASETEASETSDHLRGIIYARVSNQKQADEGNSIEGQIEALTKIAENQDINLIDDPAIDEGKTGTNLDRSGIRRVCHYARKDHIDVLLVDGISRLGRTAAETLYLIHVLQNDFGIKILTGQGEIDTSEIDGLIQATFRSLNAEMETEYQSRSATRNKVQRFLNKESWKASGQSVPIGYNPKDNDWIEVDSTEFDIVQEMFDLFRTTKNYSETLREINNRYENELNSEIKYSELRSYLKNPVYIGKPTITTNTDQFEEDKQTVSDPSLQIISKKLFEKVQKIINEIHCKNSTSDSTTDVDSAIEEFGLATVLNSSPVVKLICQVCGGEFSQNGQREIDGSIKNHNYQCKQCGVQRKWPYVDELDSMRNNTEKESQNNQSDKDGDE